MAEAALMRLERWAAANGRDPRWQEDAPGQLLITVDVGDQQGPGVAVWDRGMLLLSLVFLDEIPPGTPLEARLLAMAEINFRSGITKLGFDPQTGEVRAQALTFAPTGLDEEETARAIADLEWTARMWRAVAVRIAADEEPTD